MVGVSVTGPIAVGVIVKVCAPDPLNVNTIAVERPPPAGVIVIVPVYGALGVTVKFPEALLIAPPVGPVNVKLVAPAVT